jgi:hypothetical protein
MKGNIISPRAFSASIRIARPRAEITSGGSMMAVSQRITARIFVVGGKHRATTLVEGGDIGVDRAFVGLVVPFTCDGHAAFGNEALRAVFKDFKLIPVSSGCGTRKALQKQRPPGFSVAATNFHAHASSSAAFSWPTTTRC